MLTTLFLLSRAFLSFFLFLPEHQTNTITDREGELLSPCTVANTRRTWSIVVRATGQGKPVLRAGRMFTRKRQAMKKVTVSKRQRQAALANGLLTHFSGILRDRF